MANVYRIARHVCVIYSIFIQRLHTVSTSNRPTTISHFREGGDYYKWDFVAQEVLY